MHDLPALLAQELGTTKKGTAAALELLTGGATVPFIARYRKEATDGMDEVVLRKLAERHRYLSELETRKVTILKELTAQKALTPELKRAIDSTLSKTELEDLYLPFKPKKRTKAQIAREQGLAPLADRLWRGEKEHIAKGFVSSKKGVDTVEAAIEGALHISIETITEHAEARKIVREEASRGRFVVKKKRTKAKEKTKFDAYDQFDERAARIPSHRFLAIMRGEKEGVLNAKLELDDDRTSSRLLGFFRAGRDAETTYRGRAVLGGFKSLRTSARSETTGTVRERAEVEAAQVFAKNLEALLLSAPYGSRAVLGIDPGQRTGCKLAAVNATGKVLGHGVMQLVGSDAQRAQAKKLLIQQVRDFKIDAVAVGNGTHGRETEKFVRDALKEANLKVDCISVNESGASVYSASDVAREELPGLDITIRGAVSIARRLQDPLAELVKVDPKSIGVGQYQHDIPEKLLEAKLGEVVESAVNRVGVELNTASPSLLSYVSGIGPKLAKVIVEHRNKSGAFARRKDLLTVSGLGPKTFEQAAGFLRIQGGKEPLDQSAVHPERYPLVQRIAKDRGTSVAELIGNQAALKSLDVQKYVSDEVGLATLNDIKAELEKPGRDPRETFAAPKFREDLSELSDVKEGMQLEGAVTNVTHFGAFVDLGVHQDGLVHVSELSNTFVKSPDEVVKVGDRVRVKVLAVDLDRKRLSLSIKQALN